MLRTWREAALQAPRQLRGCVGRPRVAGSRELLDDGSTQAEPCKRGCQVVVEVPPQPSPFVLPRDHHPRPCLHELVHKASTVQRRALPGRRCG